MFQPPHKFNFQDPSSWGVWKRNFLTFRKASKLHKDPEDEQVASLLYCMGPDAEDVFATFTLAGEDADDFDKVVDAFGTYFQPKKNLLRLRRTFYARSQEQGEPIEAFVRNIYVLAEHCEFEKKEEAIRDKFVSDCNDQDLIQKLEMLYMNKPTLTLQEIVDYANTD